MALRIAATVLVLGALVVWLVAPIGNPCPDLGRLPSGSTSASSPSFSPPLTRQCTYTTADGTKARARYVPWLDWIVLLLVAAVAATATRFVGVSGARTERVERAPRAPREPRAPKQPHERDEAERERARAERARRDRGG
jgi:hypothetical protein